MKKLLLALCVIGTLATTSCTENQRAKNYGGKVTINLPENQKFVNATWKESDLWILTTERQANDVSVQNYSFFEKSSWGIWEGTINIHESAPASGLG